MLIGSEMMIFMEQGKTIMRKNRSNKKRKEEKSTYLDSSFTFSIFSLFGGEALLPLPSMTARLWCLCILYMCGI